VKERAEELVPRLLAAADEAAVARGGVDAPQARVHVVSGSEKWVPAADFEQIIEVQRAEGVVTEPRATLFPEQQLGDEWEWENTPELTVVVVDSVEQAVELFNRYSPQFVTS